MSKQLARRVGQVNKFLTVASANAAATHNNYFTYVKELSHPIDREPQIVSPEDAVACIKSGKHSSQKILIRTWYCQPYFFLGI